MRCQRCQGLLVCETFDDLTIEAYALASATRCINCGCIEDTVIRANRFRYSDGIRVIQSGRVRRGDVTCVTIHSE